MDRKREVVVIHSTVGSAGNERSERSGQELEGCGDCWVSVIAHDKVWRAAEVQEIRHNTESRTETRKCVGWLLTPVRDKFSCW